jgi:hypothetical protein
VVLFSFVDGWKRLQDDHDAVAYVRVLGNVMPPPAFEKAAGWIRAGVPAERWALLRAAIPALATVAAP